MPVICGHLRHLRFTSTGQLTQTDETCLFDGIPAILQAVLPGSEKHWEQSNALQSRRVPTLMANRPRDGRDHK